MAFGLVLGCSIPTLRLARPRLHHHRLYFANFIYSNNRGLLQLLRRRSALQRPSRPLLVPYILRLGCALSLLRPVLATLACAFIPDMLLGLENPVLASALAV